MRCYRRERRKQMRTTGGSCLAIGVNEPTIEEYERIICGNKFSQFKNKFSDVAFSQQRGQTHIGQYNIGRLLLNRFA